MPTSRSKMLFASSNGTPITTNTSTDVIAAPAATFHIEVYRIFASNSSATASVVTWRDGASGTKYYPTSLGQNGNFDLRFTNEDRLVLTTATKFVMVTATNSCSIEYTIAYRIVPD